MYGMWLNLFKPTVIYVENKEADNIRRGQITAFYRLIRMLSDRIQCMLAARHISLIL